MKYEIFEAYKKNNLEQLELILKNGGNPNVKSAAGLSLFFLTIIDNNYPASELLLKYGADPNLKLRDSCMLDRAVKQNCYEIVELLLKNEANPIFTYPDGVNLLLMYSYKVDLRIIQILITYGTDYKISDRDGNNLLMVLASTNEDKRWYWHYRLNSMRKYKRNITINEFLKEQTTLKKELIQYLFEQSILQNILIDLQ